MKKTSILFLIFAFCISFASAQNNFIEFDKNAHDFGTFKEEVGNADHVFKFKNTSNQPVKLSYVKASCGCTTPTWTKDIIQPGASGEVKASYGAKNRPGKFDKSITVRAIQVNAKGDGIDTTKTDTKILRISGEVTPRVKGIEDWYPFQDGNLRYSTNNVNYGKITNKDVKTKEMVIYNQGVKPITISNIENTKPYINFEFPQGKTVNAKDSIRAKVTYDATKVNDWEFIHDRVTMVTNDDSVAKKTIYVGATIEPDFSGMSQEQKDNGAKIEFDRETHDFGTITEGETVKTEFIFTNKGKTDLEIFKTKATCGCTVAQPDKKLLKPGESSKIPVTFNSSGKKGPTTKQITVVTNDPTNPVKKLNIKSDITEKAGAATDKK